MTQYMASTHPRHDKQFPAEHLARTVGAHRKPTRWTTVWVRIKGRR